MQIGVQSLKTCIAQSQVSWIFVQPVCFLFYFSFIGFSDAPTPLTTYSSRPLSVESFKSFTIGNPLGYRGSACVEVMTILHGSIPSIRRRVEGCVPLEGTIASARDPLKSTSLIFRATLTLQVKPQILRSGFHFLHVGASVGLQSRVSSDRFNYLHNSLLYI